MSAAQTELPGGRLRRGWDAVAASQPLMMLLLTVAAIAIWYGASFHRLVASPPSAFAAAYQGLASGQWGEHLWWTTRATLVGFAIGACAGLGLGIALGLWTSLRQVLGGVVYGLASVPKLVIFPIILVLFKIGITSETVFVAVSAVFLVLINTMVAVQQIDPVHLKVARSNLATPWQTAIKVVLPSVAPSVVTGLRLGFSMGLVHAILAEMALGNVGLGTRMWIAYRDLDMPKLYGLVLLVAVMAIASNGLLWLVERRLRGDSTTTWATI